MERRYSAGIVLGLVLSLSLSGCGLVKTSYRVLTEEKANVDAISHDLFATDLAGRFALMAMFADISYRRDLLPYKEKINHCDVSNPHYDPAYGMPQPATVTGKWERWHPGKGIPACVDDAATGLFYETYIYTDRDAIVREAVIAYRGTENHRGQFLHDWGTNISNALGFEPNQYALAQQHLKVLLPALTALQKQDQKPFPIYATGHSLGGGLAQQAGYLSRQITAVYAFDTSPVSNWTNLELDEIDAHYPTIYRFYHTGEVLHNLRNITTFFNSSRYNRYDIGIQLRPRKMFDGHEMAIIACGLMDILRKAPESVPIAHHISRESAFLYALSPHCADYQKRAIR